MPRRPGATTAPGGGDRRRVRRLLGRRRRGAARRLGGQVAAHRPLAVRAPPRLPPAGTPSRSGAGGDHDCVLLGDGGRLVATSVAPRAACAGTVTLTAKAGKETLLTKTAGPRLKDRACEYAAKLSLSAKQRGKATSVEVTAAFSGNDALLAATSKARRLKLA
ncbi:MAG: hypothetical protein R3C15_13680 [Thermoleophilia bacterium]